MTKTTRKIRTATRAPAHKPSAAAYSGRSPATLEQATAVCPTDAQITAIAEKFGLHPTPSATIHDRTKFHLGQIMDLVKDDLGERGLQIFLQRIVGSFVAAAYSAGQVYSNAVSEAHRLTNPLLNDHRDEDRDGIYGFDDRAQRKREYAAERALQAHATLAAAQGAAQLYREVIGDPWKPYVAPSYNAPSLDRQAAATQMAAFQ